MPEFWLLGALQGLPLFTFIHGWTFPCIISRFCLAFGSPSKPTPILPLFTDGYSRVSYQIFIYQAIWRKLAKYVVISLLLAEFLFCLIFAFWHNVRGQRNRGGARCLKRAGQPKSPTDYLETALPLSPIVTIQPRLPYFSLVKHDRYGV